jgi:hypothetical protein
MNKVVVDQGITTSSQQAGRFGWIDFGANEE